MLKKPLLFVFVGLLMMFIFYGNVSAAGKKVKSIQGIELKVVENVKNLNSNFTINYIGDDPKYSKKMASMIPNLIRESSEVNGLINSYEYKSSKTNAGTMIRIKMTYFTSKVKEDASMKEIKKQATKIKREHSSTLNRIKAVNDYVVLNTTYGGSKGKDAYSKYGVTHLKEAYCQGYAMVAYELLKELGIPVIFVYGYSKGNTHLWNKVKMDGKWYNLDTTWNDISKGNGKNKAYNYFLVSDQTMQRDHSWNNSELPKSNSENFDFLNKTSSAEFVGSKIYYANNLDNQKLYVYDMNTRRAKKLSNTRMQYLAYAKGNLYFSNFSDRGRLAKYNLKSKKIYNLNNRYSQFVHIKGNNVYFYSNNVYFKQKL